MRRVDIKRTNEQAVQRAIQLARNALVRAMPHRAAGEWQVIVRWTAGTIDHLEPQQQGSDAPSDQTGCGGPAQPDMRRIERAIGDVVLGAVTQHPFGRLNIRIPWRDGQVGEIQHAICESHKVEPVTGPA